MSNLKTVQDIYQAFGRGDIPAILDKLWDNIEWEYPYRAAPNPVPWLQPRENKEGVAQFFESLAALEFHQFTPKAFLEEPGLVVVLLDFEATVKETGQRIVEMDEVHIWRFNEDGKVVRFRHCADTYQQAAACQSQRLNRID
jgi:ketosteroid isomerase-like protein